MSAYADATTRMDASGRTAIVFAAPGKDLLVIRMTDGPLAVEVSTLAKVDREFPLSPYADMPAEERKEAMNMAAFQYLTHAAFAGIYRDARALLFELHTPKKALRALIESHTR